MHICNKFSKVVDDSLQNFFEDKESPVESNVDVSVQESLESNSLREKSTSVDVHQNDSFNHSDDEKQEPTMDDSMEHIRSRYSRLNALFTSKELFDRIGYGLGAHQFITILFFLTGAGPLLVGLINGLRDVIGDVCTSLIESYRSVATLGKSFVSYSGILFGFSFLLLLFSFHIGSSVLYAISFLIGSFGIVLYGQVYTQLLEENIKYERKNWFLKRGAYVGIVITAFSFLISGFLLDYFGLSLRTVSFFGMSFPISGYFLMFELSAIAFILSGFILSKAPLRQQEERTYPLTKFFQEQRHEIRENAKLFFKNTYIKLLFLGALLLSVIQSLGGTFYGFYIYEQFQFAHFGGFLNISILFGIAILVSFIGPKVTHFVYKSIGLAPMFVFGSLLLGMVPLVLVYNPHFYAIAVSISLAVLGSSIIGVAQGLITQKLLPSMLRKQYYQSYSFYATIPFLLLVGLGSYVAYAFSIIHLFVVMLLLIVCCIVPLYFNLVVLANKKRL